MMRPDTKTTLVDEFELIIDHSRSTYPSIRLNRMPDVLVQEQSFVTIFLMC
jgi:hypothetical protein